MFQVYHNYAMLITTYSIAIQTYTYMEDLARSDVCRSLQGTPVPVTFQLSDGLSGSTNCRPTPTTEVQGVYSQRY